MTQDAESGRFSVDEVADASGLSPRTIRYYIGERVLPPPIGSGRAAYYTTQHVALANQIRDLRAKRHSIDEIRALVTADATPEPDVGAEAWLRLRLHDDLELHVRRDAPENIHALARELRAAAERWFWGDETE